MSKKIKIPKEKPVKSAVLIQKPFSEIFEDFESSNNSEKSKPLPSKIKNNKQNFYVAKPETNSFKADFLRYLDTHDNDSAVKKKINLDNADLSNNTKSIKRIRQMKIQSRLDLHGKILEQALQEVSDFIQESYKKGLRKIIIVTGKGFHSERGEAILRPAVLAQLKGNSDIRSKIREVNENPKAEDGGSGAVIVILKENSKV